jgi:hypothetical protein
LVIRGSSPEAIPLIAIYIFHLFSQREVLADGGANTQETNRAEGGAGEEI